MIILVISIYNIPECIAAGRIFQQDTLKPTQDSIDSVTISAKSDSIEKIIKKFYRGDREGLLEGDSLIMKSAANNSFISVQQLIKGNISGVNVQENSAEPGAIQNMVVRGLSSPLFSNRDTHDVQPAVYVDGIPLISDHPFAYNIRSNDVSRIGPSTNELSSLNIDNIKSVEVIKDPAELHRLGPLAANGAIWITTKDARVNYREVSVNMYGGVVTPEAITPINADYQREFRETFYNKYDISTADNPLPSYLNDRNNPNYFGSANWVDSFYKVSPVYNTNMAISSGSERANFRFTAGRTVDAGTEDETSMALNNASFLINMVPFEWMKVTAMINGAISKRNKNRSFRDRYAETGYLPDLSTPVSPSLETYELLTDEYEKSIDDNVNNYVRGYLSGEFEIDALDFTTNLMFDYNEGIRDIFWPSTLMADISYVSNYFSYNQRFLWSNELKYQFDFDKSKIDIGAFGSLQEDMHRYNYAKAFDGPNDFIKTANDGDFDVFRYTDRQSIRLLSVGGYVNYEMNDFLRAGVSLRYDGISSSQPDSRWKLSPSGFAEIDFSDFIFPRGLNILKARVSYAQLGKIQSIDRYSEGPQYSVNLGWDGVPTISSYNGYAGLSRPYATGWVGYDLGWPYSEKMAFELDGVFFNNFLHVNLNLYNNDEKDLPVAVPIPVEYGYSSEIKSGMVVNNRGVELGLSAPLINKDFKWNIYVNTSYNRNRLSKLPGGREEMIVDNRKLQVGESIDKFWVYENRGIYEETSQIPVENGSPITFEGEQILAGDPIWTDFNKDFKIDEKDKVLKGNSTPDVFGGISNTFQYKNWDLDIHMFYALGHEALNIRDSQQYDFPYTSTQNNLNSVQEIFFWQENKDSRNYPIYNPWSSVRPYRPDQDLFLEDLSFLKLRSVRLGYNLKFGGGHSVVMNRAYIYINATNLLTITDFSGGDPELVGFNGYYDGYGVPFGKTFILGVNFKL